MPTTTPRRSRSRSPTSTTSCSSTSAAWACRSRSACPNATAVYYQTDNDPTDPAQFDGAASDAKTYADACLAETKVDPADLPFYSTRQAVEDLEAFRQYLGVDKLALYGESYGTQYVQTYADAHPDHVASLFVDGPVDLTMDAPAFYREEVRAFDDALTATLTDCDTDRVCRRDTASRGDRRVRRPAQEAPRRRRSRSASRRPRARS